MIRVLDALSGRNKKKYIYFFSEAVQFKFKFYFFFQVEIVQLTKIFCSSCAFTVPARPCLILREVCVCVCVSPLIPEPTPIPLPPKILF